MKRAAPARGADAPLCPLAAPEPNPARVQAFEIYQGLRPLIDAAGAAGLMHGALALTRAAQTVLREAAERAATPPPVTTRR